MQEFMRKWTGIFVLVLGVVTSILGILSLFNSVTQQLFLAVGVLTGGVAVVFTGLAIHGMTDGMNQIGDVLTQIIKGLQER